MKDLKDLKNINNMKDMKKSVKVIQINGFSGLLTVAFIVCCLAAGFIAFPALVCTYAWNFIAHKVGIATVGYLGGLLLWGILVVSYMILTSKHKLISFGRINSLSDEEMQSVISRIKSPDFMNIEKDFVEFSQRKNYDSSHLQNPEDSAASDIENSNNQEIK